LQNFFRIITVRSRKGYFMKHNLLWTMVFAGWISLPFMSRGQEDISVLRQLAEQGDAAAQTRLGACYYSGCGVPQSCTEAVKWYRLAAKQGVAAAQTGLGFAYYGGSGVPQNYTEAVKWLHLAAKQGDTAALSLLGGCYYLGSGVAKDYAEAARCLRLAAEKGDVVAQYNLGGRYYRGEGVPKDCAQAYAWTHIAATQEHEGAKKLQSICLQEMTPEQIEQGQKLAQEYAEKFLKQAATP
jgi:TPR repeat protein